MKSSIGSWCINSRLRNNLKKNKILRSHYGGIHLKQNDWKLPRARHCYELTAPYTPQSNDIAKRKNIILMDIVNCVLISSGAPKNLWGEALLSACYILNRVPQKNDITQYEGWKGRIPNINFFKVLVAWLRFQCLNPIEEKLAPKSLMLCSLDMH